jgi:hypothetical protein
MSVDVADDAEKTNEELLNKLLKEIERAESVENLLPPPVIETPPIQNTEVADENNNHKNEETQTQADHLVAKQPQAAVPEDPAQKPQKEKPTVVRVYLSIY